MEDILAQAKKVTEEAEVFMVSTDETLVQFEANRLKHIQSKQSTALALRVIKDGKIGYATTTDLNDQNLVDMAIETAQFGTPARYELPSIKSYPEVKIFDPGIESISSKEMINLGEKMVTIITDNTPDILCEADITKSIMSVRIINSNGGQASYKQSIFSLGIEGQIIHDTDMLFVGEGQSSCHPIKEIDAITSVVLRQLELSKNQASVPTKSLPVIFTPDGIASTMVMPLISAFNGKVVLEGASPIGNKIGEMVFDKNLSLWDDATIDYRLGSHPCDDEGIPSQRTPLIKKGVVTNFLYDLQTASLAGTKSTGNGHRSRGSLPTPSPNSFILSTGNTSFNDMVKDIKEGLVIEQVMGASHGNLLGGDFSGNVLLGYKIENGKIIGRVKDTMISGNIYNLLKQIAAIGNDNKWVSSFLNTPSLYFSNVSIATKN
ncbi:TldD/PmbA family protein [Chloroflexota bacterium]